MIMAMERRVTEKALDNNESHNLSEYCIAVLEMYVRCRLLHSPWPGGDLSDRMSFVDQQCPSAGDKIDAAEALLEQLISGSFLSFQCKNYVLCMLL